MTRAAHEVIVRTWEREYEHVLYPKLPFTPFVARDGSRGSRQARRDAHDAAPMALFRRAMHRATVVGHFNVHVVSERSSTGTCSWCEQWNNVGPRAHVFECNHCGLQTGRDVNAAKNILMSETMRPFP